MKKISFTSCSRSKWAKTSRDTCTQSVCMYECTLLMAEMKHERERDGERHTFLKNQYLMMIIFITPMTLPIFPRRRSHCLTLTFVRERERNKHSRSNFCKFLHETSEWKQQPKNSLIQFHFAYTHDLRQQIFFAKVVCCYSTTEKSIEREREQVCKNHYCCCCSFFSLFCQCLAEME